jgi:hypothetical protein
MNIHSNFFGGNITVTKQNEHEVYLENQLRDSSVDWFYWAFCVEGAEGREITFNFQNDRLGYFGPAVSHDLKEWNWLNSGDESSFTYRFGENEIKVYFAHSLLYHPERFSTLCERLRLEEKELCKSRRGRSVPCLKLGEGKTSIILTARHHACESTGNYVIEGILEEISSSPIPDSRILIVPFVDYDGVVEGDQGKCRSPHDHNRDYTETPLYPEVKAIIDYSNAFGCNYGDSAVSRQPECRSRRRLDDPEHSPSLFLVKIGKKRGHSAAGNELDIRAERVKAQKIAPQYREQLLPRFSPEGCVGSVGENTHGLGGKKRL